MNKKNISLNGFLQSTGGVALIETVIVLPLLLLILFVTIELGNYGLKRYALITATTSIAEAIQNNPSIPSSQVNQVKNMQGLGTLNMNLVALNYNTSQVTLTYDHPWIAQITKNIFGNTKRITYNEKINTRALIPNCRSGQELVSTGNGNYACKNPKLPRCSNGQTFVWRDSYVQPGYTKPGKPGYFKTVYVSCVIGEPNCTCTTYTPAGYWIDDYTMGRYWYQPPDVTSCTKPTQQWVDATPDTWIPDATIPARFTCTNIPTTCGVGSELKFDSTDQRFKCTAKTENCRTIITQGPYNTVNQSIWGEAGTNWKANQNDKCLGAGEYVKSFTIRHSGIGDDTSAHKNCASASGGITSNVVTAIGGGNEQNIICQKMTMTFSYQCCSYK